MPLPQAAFQKVKEVDTNVGRSSSLRSKLCMALLPSHHDAKQLVEIQQQITIPLELYHSVNLFQTFWTLKRPVERWPGGSLWTLRAVKTGLNHLTLLNPISES